MSRFTHIKAVAFSVLITSLSASAVQAANLTPEERSVCPTLKFCVDIIRRHDASEFDYDVLEEQFRRFGPTGRKALFDVLDSKAGNADIARMISIIGPLTAVERSRIQANWTVEASDTYLPLLLDGHASSRDLLLLSLGSDEAFIREAARQALLKLPKNVQNQPLSHALREPLLAALLRDPIAAAAPYIERLSVEGHEDAYIRLLGSAEPALASAAYAALFRQDPSKSFNALLAEMGQFTSSEQSQAIGEMMLRRHAGRSDGFYLKFARDISGDKTRPIPSRASGLHAVLIAGETEVPEFTPERAEALGFLISGQPFTAQDKYLPALKKAKAERALTYIWRVAQQEKWVNRDEISAFYKGEKIENAVISDLIRSDDFRGFSAGVKQAKPIHQTLLRAQTGHAIKAIAQLAHQKLDLPVKRYPKNTCLIAQFDSQDVLNQMPYFNKGWARLENDRRVVLDRKHLTAAHPSQSGWLAGYNLETTGSKKTHIGGALVHFDNKTGESQQVGDFKGPMAILPDRALKLGQYTDRFWVIDNWRSASSGVSAYLVNLSGLAPKVLHLSALPNTASQFSVAPNGDLLMGFDDDTQIPIRLTPRGDLSPACAAPRAAPQVPAPN